MINYDEFEEIDDEEFSRLIPIIKIEEVQYYKRNRGINSEDDFDFDDTEISKISQETSRLSYISN